MIFRLENLGPLREAEVDLSKRLIVLTGPNNTGKTYLAWSLYGLFRAPDAREVFRPLVREILDAPAQEVAFGRVRDLWPAVLDAVAARLAGRLHLCFATVRESFKNVGVALRAAPGEPEPHTDGVHGKLFAAGVSGHVSIDSRVVAIRLSVRNPRDPGAMQPITIAEVPAEVRDGVLTELAAHFSWAVFRACWPRCTLLPAERTAVDLFAKELSSRRNELVNDVVEAGLDDMADPLVITCQVGRYPWPIQDSLSAANDLALWSRLQSEFADLAVELEVLLGGAVGLSEQGEVRFVPRGGGGPIGIHLASSVVKSLVSLVFFFRHRADEGDLLMIDEPELNLHPDNQRKVADVLARAVRRGLRVIMSTHSDYIIRELDHLIMLSKLSAEEASELGYDPECALPPEQVGVYLFDDNTAQPVEVDETGFSVKTIDDEINRMQNMSQRFYAKFSR